MIDGSIRQNAAGEQLRADIFFRGYQNIQHFFDSSGVNQVRLWLFVLTYNLGNFMRRLVLPEDMKP